MCNEGGETKGTVQVLLNHVFKECNKFLLQWMLGCSFQPSTDTMKTKLCWVTLGTASISKSATEVMVFSNQCYAKSNPDPENQPKEVLDFGCIPFDRVSSSLRDHFWHIQWNLTLKVIKRIECLGKRRKFPNSVIIVAKRPFNFLLAVCTSPPQWGTYQQWPRPQDDGSKAW